VGCGKISDIYLTNLREFEETEVVVCADLDEERARAKAKEYGVPKAVGVAELLADPEVEVVLNLTPPQAHATVSLAALREGKHVYTEKPLAVDLEDGRRMLEEAEAGGLRIGCAPDTFLGGGLQTCRKLIDDGAIGEPVAANAAMMSHGTEGWHPDPGFFYGPGGGPMLDMGPYYLTALATLVGPIRRVWGEAKITFPERTIASEPKKGQKIKVRVPTHVAGIMDFENGAMGTIVTSFDAWGTQAPNIEVHGSEASLRVPDPNFFRGPVQIRRAGLRVPWEEVPLTHGFTKNSRGIGLRDMARALRSGEPHRASGALGYHVLETMHAFLKSAEEGRRIAVQSSFGRPAPLPVENTFFEPA
jgi:predicted dehydrogenase